MDTMEFNKESNENNTSTNNGNNTIYYAVYTPNEYYDPTVNIFEDKVEALKVAKKNKKSRFKTFQFYHEAVEFALRGSECPNVTSKLDITADGPQFNNLNLSELSQQPQQSVGEKASPFKGPKPQELVELRKAIENGNLKTVRDTIWQNPRYLVSSGDTPSILQEGPRYNALHVAAKAKNAPITELILSTVSDVEFVKLLYGDDNLENAQERTKVLLDLYLNTPNKGLNETPLHFAAKYGADDVVEILVSYPQCDKTLKNKFQKTADQIICERAEGGNLSPIKKRISVLLQQNYYVPVLRSEDNSIPPTIGAPFSPTQPPVFNKNPLSPRLEIHAYAGPMGKPEAEKFRKIWKTPPRSLGFNSSGVKRFGSEDVISVSLLRFKDPSKGLERIGSNLASEHDVTWKEYWPFLDSFVNITSEEGLNLLEEHLAERTEYLNDSFGMKPLKKSPPVTTHINKSDILSPISNLCLAFQNCNINDSNKHNGPVTTNCDKSEINPVLYIDKACQVFSNRISNDILYILCSEYNNIAPVLETEIKQLELLITSYMEDNRFSSVSFQKVHSRLGALVSNKLCFNIEDDSRQFLCGKLEFLLDCITKNLDYFSSDDEANHFKETEETKKPTSYKKQLICLVRFILKAMSNKENTTIDLDNENECVQDWNSAEECLCTYHVRKSKKNSLSRSGSFKNKNLFRTEFENVPVKLNFEEEDSHDDLNHHNNINRSLNAHNSDDASTSSDDEAFYTPPSSPSFIDELDSDSDNEFNDTKLPDNDVFIEGNRPSKTDYDVFNAIKYSKCVLSQRTYPHIYKWRHTIGLYSESERERWPSPNHLKIKQKEFVPGTPNGSTLNVSWSNDSPKCSTPSKSWLRITGANSPIAAFRNLHGKY